MKCWDVLVCRFSPHNPQTLKLVTKMTIQGWNICKQIMNEKKIIFGYCTALLQEYYNWVVSACTCVSLFCFSTKITSSKLKLVHNRKLSQKWIIIVSIMLSVGFLVVFKVMVTIKQKGMLSSCNLTSIYHVKLYFQKQC